MPAKKPPKSMDPPILGAPADLKDIKGLRDFMTRVTWGYCRHELPDNEAKTLAFLAQTMISILKQQHEAESMDRLAKIERFIDENLKARNP